MQTTKKIIKLEQPEIVGYDETGAPIMSDEKTVEVNETVSLNLPYVKGYNEDGTPIFKKKVKDVNIMIKRQQTSDKILFGLFFAIVIIHCISLMFPFVWMILSSLKGKWVYFFDSQNHIFLTLPHIVDGANADSAVTEYVTNFLGMNFVTVVDESKQSWFFVNYLLAITQVKYNNITFLQLVWNSVWITVVQTALSVFMPTMTGYVMSKYKFWGRNFLYSFVIFTMVVPVIGSSAAGLMLHSRLGTLNTPIYPVLCSLGGFGSSYLVYYGFFKSVSWSYAEAAQMDGGGPFTIFFKIMLPQASAIMLTYAITNSMTYWGQTESIMMYMWSYPNLAAGLYMMSEAASRPTFAGGYPAYLAGLVISMIPSLVLFACFSEKILHSVSIGGLKG